ncbi:MAG: hypothetical protein ABW185_03165, partial [Sedimenticola sp.]
MHAPPEKNEMYIPFPAFWRILEHQVLQYLLKCHWNIERNIYLIADFRGGAHAGSAPPPLNPPMVVL